MSYLLIASGKIYPEYRMPDNSVYYGFENDDGQLKIKKYTSKTSRGIKSKMHRQDSISKLFAAFFVHFRKFDDDMSSKIIERHAIYLDMGYYEFIRKAELLYREILENNPEKLI
jgi:hypothetical protein